MNIYVHVCVCCRYVCIRVGKENIKTAKKTAPFARWAWFFRLIGPGKTAPARLHYVHTMYIYISTHYYIYILILYYLYIYTMYICIIYTVR